MPLAKSNAISIALKSQRCVPGIGPGNRPILTQSEKLPADSVQYAAACSRVSRRGVNLCRSEIVLSIINKPSNLFTSYSIKRHAIANSRYMSLQCWPIVLATLVKRVRHLHEVVGSACVG